MPIRPQETGLRHEPLKSCGWRGSCWGAAFGLLCTVGQAMAAVNDLPTTWACWYDGATAVSCQLLSAPDLPGLTSTSEAPPSQQPQVAAPVGRRPLPVLVDIILNQPKALYGRHISIPMFTVPEDMKFVRELAEAVMCGTRDNCRVRFLISMAEAALLTDQFEDPVLN